MRDKKFLYVVRASGVEMRTLEAVARYEQVKTSEALRLAVKEAARVRGLFTPGTLPELEREVQNVK